MRATLRITWLLLLPLNFLFGSVCADDATSVTKDSTTLVPNSTATVAAAIISTSNAPTRVQTTPGTTLKPMTKADYSVAPTHPATKPTDPQPTFAVTKPVTQTVTTIAEKTQPKPITVTNRPSVAPPLTSPTPGVILPAATSSKPQITTPAATTNTAVGTVQPTKPSTEKAIENTSQSKTSAVPSRPPGVLSSAGPTRTTTVQTTAPTSDQGLKTTTVITVASSQGDTNGATKEASKTSPVPTPSRSTASAGNPETTTPPSSQTKPEVTIKTGTTPSQTTRITTGITTRITSGTSATLPKKFIYSLLGEQETKEEKELAEVCRRLMPEWQNGTCTLTWRHSNGRVVFELVEINGHVKSSLASQYYDDITKKPTDNKTLIAILASCGALLIMIVILAVCASHHRKPYSETQQHLTEELHTVENGYHDNPTLEVMEVQAEMQEKKMALNGEFNDSWIVPIDNLLKGDVPDEEDTHL